MTGYISYWCRQDWGHKVCAERTVSQFCECTCHKKEGK